MKTRLTVFFAVSLMAICRCFGQNVVLFTNVYCTSEQAIKLTWISVSNETYQIQCASELATNGITTWETLYDEYPSQGSSTFWLDTGNYFANPPVAHPKYASERFYRILDEGQDQLTNDEPSSVIVSPASGTVITGDFDVAVTNYSDQAMIVGNLYIDGQLMKPSFDGTNYMINSCEFANGEHLLFATATAYSSATAENGTYAMIGHSVSTFVPVYFSNLISEISFSEPFFQPSLGETQEITASLAANCNWTLTIDDGNTNVFRTATGTGNSVLFDWNGTSDGGTNVPVGVYYYYISAETNGEAMLTSSRPSPDFAMESLSKSLWAVDTNTKSVVPLMLYPPGFNVNNLTVISATPSEASTIRGDTIATTATGTGDVRFSPDGMGSPDGGTPSSQNNGATPTRGQYTGAVGSHGNFAVAYDTYSAVGWNGYFQPEVPESYALGSLITYVQIEGHGTADPPKWSELPWNAHVAINFTSTLMAGGWSPALVEADNDLTIGQLKGYGNSNPLNTNDFAMLLLHGGYGSTSDMSLGNSIKQMYFPITSGTSASYLRMSDFDLGGATTNSGLKWLALNACYGLYPANWNSMQSQNVFPYNSNMHMILSGATETVSSPSQGTFFAQDLMGNPTAKIPIPPMTLRDAWYDSFRRGLKADLGLYGAYPNPTSLTVACNPNCLDDYLQTRTNTVLSTDNLGKWTLDTPVQVYP